jgi:HK97 family phage portal protein
MPLFNSDITTLALEAPEKRSGMFGDPTTPLTAVAVWNEMGGGPTASGEIVTERTAMSVSTVYTCVTLISEAVASLPCNLMRRLDKGREVATDHYLYDLLASSPNPEMTAFTFWATIVGCSALTGNAYAEITRDPDGAPNGFWPLHPLKTEPVRQPDGTLAFRTHDGMKDGNYRVIVAKDILHFPLFSLSGIRGVGPISAAREAFALAKAAEKFGARWFGNGAHAPSILINKGPKPDPKVQREFRESWHEAYGGSNANKQAILFGEWDVKTVGLSPEDSQFLATRNFQRADIAAMFHLSPTQAGDTARMSNTNHVQSQLTFVTDCLRPILVRIEMELQRKLLNKSAGKLFVTFDLSERLRGDTQTQMQSYALGRQWGFLCVNDIREDLGMNPIGPEGDTYLYPTNMGDANQLLRDKDLIPITQTPDDAQPDDPQNPVTKAKK